MGSQTIDSDKRGCIWNNCDIPRNIRWPPATQQCRKLFTAQGSPRTTDSVPDGFFLYRCDLEESILTTQLHLLFQRPTAKLHFTCIIDWGGLVRYRVRRVTIVSTPTGFPGSICIVLVRFHVPRTFLDY